MSIFKDYTCPRCDYKTRIRNDMRKHLYRRQRPCPGQTNNIELTDEIREQVLNNRVYDIKQVSSTSNDNPTLQLNNVVIGMETQEKLNHVLEYQERRRPTNFGDQIGLVYGPKIRQLEDRGYKWGFKLDHHNLLELVDQSVLISSREDLHNMNLLYVAELNKIAIFHDDEWTYYLFDIGLNRVISIIQDHYLESYENYLLYKLFLDKGVGGESYNNFKVQLNDYFRFLAVFDLLPSVYKITKLSNKESLPGFEHENPFYISDFCHERYFEQKESLSKSETNQIRKQIGEIIKTNNGANIRLLNKYIINLAVNDQVFKERLLQYSQTK